MAPSPYRFAHKSIIMPQYCYSMHYHTCLEFVDRAAAKRRGRQPRVGDLVVNQSYALSHHYRPCSRGTLRHSCDRLLANTTLDDTVLRYRHQLFDNVQRAISAGILNDNNATAKVLSRKRQ